MRTDIAKWRKKKNKKRITRNATYRAAIATKKDKEKKLVEQTEKQKKAKHEKKRPENPVIR